MAAKLIALVLPLGLDTFAVAAALGMATPDRASRARVCAVLCLFEAGMPLVGLAFGASLSHVIGATAEYLAIALLLAYGLYALLGSDAGEERRLVELAGSSGPGMLLLGLSVSLDELALGFALGLLHVPIPLVIALIATQALILSQLGFRIGARLSERVREGAERLAGAALTGLAVVLMAEKLLS